MRARSLILVLALAASASPVAGHADGVKQDRSTEAVVLTGAQFPSWSAGPDPTFREPQPPVNYDTADVEQYMGPAQSDCYKPGQSRNPYDRADNGEHNCYQRSRVPANPNTGAAVEKLLGYRWNGTKFVQIPFQVDERFTRYISNNRSGFAFYSGVDQETTYAWDREAFRYTSDDFVLSGGDPCHSQPAADSPMANGKATTVDPVKGLDDNDELAFMYSDAGAQAPTGSALPEGIASSFEVAVADPTDGRVVFAYVMLAKPDGPVAQFTASNGYVRYVRDANADMFAYSQSSYGGYGAAPVGPYCNLDGTVATTADPNYAPPAGIAHPSNWLIKQRRPLDGAWVKTPRYWFRYDGRWLMTQLRVSPDDSGLSTNPNLGPDIIDQWKARAFQQRPGGQTPCCGYEEEVNNWGGSSILFGERTGAVRAIRAAWGADSSTNNIKTETFYRDEVRFGDALRVHVIPPADGIYVQWDYNAGTVAKYYNPFQPNGVAADGRNDEVFGNTNVHLGNDRVEFRDDDPTPVTGPLHVTVPGDGSDPNSCNFGTGDGICNDLDFADPTFSGPAGDLNWEEVDGPNGAVVTRWTIKEHTGGDAYSLIAQPYYRDDSCFDDGTGSNPGPHLRSRHVDDGAQSKWLNPATGQLEDRVCWKPGDVLTGDPALDARYWQGDVATHGLHIQLIADSDNAAQTVPVDEIVSEQRMVVLHPNQGNVGEQHGRGTVEFPLAATARPYV
jgi:hypothetical protein